MKLEPSTIRAAFDMHHKRYGTRPRAWDSGGEVMTPEEILAQTRRLIE